jgi:AmiR/NasT family two-component response regulator
MAPSVLRDLRNLRVQVIHPPDTDGRDLVEHLRRIGCAVETAWPIPETSAANADVVMLAIAYDHREEIRRLLRGSETRSTTLIAIVDYENPATLQLVLECGALAVVDKPIRPFGLLTSVILARTLWLERVDAQRRLRKLASKLSGLQKLQRAKSILMQSQHVSEHDAHEIIRVQAMAKRISLEDMATAIINANDLLTKKIVRS